MKTVTVRITDLARAVTAFEAWSDGPGQDEERAEWEKNAEALARLYALIGCPACKCMLSYDGDCDACGWTDTFDQE